VSLGLACFRAVVPHIWAISACFVCIVVRCVGTAVEIKGETNEIRTCVDTSRDCLMGVVMVVYRYMSLLLG